MKPKRQKSINSRKLQGDRIFREESVFLKTKKWSKNSVRRIRMEQIRASDQELKYLKGDWVMGKDAQERTQREIW